MAESELAVLTSQCLSRRIPDKPTLEKEVAAWERHRNKHHAKADWQFTTENARVKLKRLYPQFEWLARLGLFELMDVKEYAAGILGRKTDIMTRDSLHKVLRQNIEASAVRVF